MKHCKNYAPVYLTDGLYAVVLTLAHKNKRTFSAQIRYMLLEYLAGYGIYPQEVLFND